MKVFLAGSYADKERLRERMSALEDVGFDVTSTWLREPFDAFETEWHRRAAAEIDLTDVKRSDVMIICEDCPSTSGGRYVEMGWALAHNVPVFVLGTAPKNPYFALPGVTHIEDLSDFCVANR